MARVAAYQGVLFSFLAHALLLTGLFWEEMRLGASEGARRESGGAVNVEFQSNLESSARKSPQDIGARARNFVSQAGDFVLQAGNSGSKAGAFAATETQYVSGLLGSNPAPEYPALSRLRGEEGRVVLVAFLGQGAEAARLRELRVESSSGFSRLDAAALAAVRAWRFPSPAPGSEVRVPIRFSLVGSP